MVLAAGLLCTGAAADDQTAPGDHDPSQPTESPCPPPFLTGGNDGDDGTDGPTLEVICETLDVTSERPPPILTVIKCPGPIQPDDLELGPVYRLPWSLVTTAPGVQADRQPRDGAVDPPRLNAPGTAGEPSTLRVDGFEITEDSSGESSFELGLWSFEEIEIASGGGGADVAMAGPRIDLTIPGAGNNWRGSGRYLGAGDGTGGSQSSSNSLRRSTIGELALGGGLRRDHLWLWGAVSETDSEHRAIGGQSVESDLGHATGKLTLSAADTVLVAAWHRGSTREGGHAAGPARLPEATWDRERRARLVRLEADHVASANLILTGGYGELERRVGHLPLGRDDAETGPLDAFTDGSGVTGGATFDQTGRHETREWRLDGALFVSSPRVSHDFEIGFRQRRHSALDRWSGGGARWVETGSNFHFTSGEGTDNPSARDVLTSWHDSSGRTDLEQAAGWLQDTLEVARLTLVLGLRWDQQQGTSRVNTSRVNTSRVSTPVGANPDFRHATAEWRTVLPRLGLTLRLDQSGRGLLRATYGRFASRLGSALAARLPRGFPIADLQLFNDTDGDLAFDLEENGSRVAWFGTRPDLLAPDLRPELTDETSIGIEREISPRFRAGLTLTHRRSHNLLERRTLIRESDDTIRPAVVGDWRPAEPLSGQLSGQLPDGRSYGVNAFDLSPDLELVPSGLWVNGDRRRESLATSLTWRGSFARWQTRGHLSWHDSRWRLGPEFLHFDDPTDSVGSGDDGDGVVELVPRDRLGSTELAVDSRWSFHWAARADLPRDLALGLALAGREGHPLPYFRRVARPVAGIASVQLTDRVDSVRAPDIFTLDARLTKEITLGDYSLSLVLEAFNLLEAEDVLRRELDLGVVRGGEFNEMTTPRVWRAGVRLGWR